MAVCAITIWLSRTLDVSRVLVIFMAFSNVKSLKIASFPALTYLQPPSPVDLSKLNLPDIHIQLFEYGSETIPIRKFNEPTLI